MSNDTGATPNVNPDQQPQPAQPTPTNPNEGEK